MKPTNAVLAVSLLSVSALATPALAQVEVVYASTSHSPGPRTVVPTIGGGTLTFKNFAKPYRSPSNARWAVVATTNTGVGSTDQCLVIGQGLTGMTVAQEGTFTDSGGGFYAFGVLTNPCVRDNGDWAAVVTNASLIANGEKVITGTLTAAGSTTPTVIATELLAAPPAGSGGFFGDNAFNSPMLTDIGPAFTATVTSAAYTAAGFINGTPVAKVGVDVPVGQGGGGTAAWATIASGQFYVDRTGQHWLARGTLAGGVGVIVRDGIVLAQAGFPLAGMPGTVTTLSETYLDPNGDWYARGTNSDGATWAVRNGVRIARTGEPILGATTEAWTTIQDVRGNFAGDYVVLGTTNEPNTLINQVLVVNNKAVIVRKSDGVDLDGDRVNEANLFVHTISAGRMIPNDDGYLYFSTQMKLNATDTTGITGNNNSLVRLPMCPADLGVQGGLPGVDHVFDNNDFVVFINSFFDQHPRSDLGRQGGIVGRDGLFDNNDFVAFIELFFTACR